ncbi:hypothetical protein BpHYR1_027615 [Brachionus plicatilis]|uniref:Uncharacterized protein n=1 Tax=Brachionus plicatilis TaxID=10195 RepID=A0A3M7S462_BRAPC|nr:hypothetical protein BpHYR1_027615 [Brachionus plicatilis]
MILNIMGKSFEGSNPTKGEKNINPFHCIKEKGKIWSFCMKFHNARNHEHYQKGVQFDQTQKEHQERVVARRKKL